MRASPLVTLGALLIGVAILAMANSACAQNLLRNGDFAEGHGNEAADWHTISWVDLPDTKFIWIAPAGGEPGLVSISDPIANDTAWVQSLHLHRGWYYAGAQAKAVCGEKGKDSVLYGALISLADVGVVSPDLVPSHDWQDLGFYFRVGPDGADVELQLRLVCPSDYRVGQAFFRSASVVKVDAPPAHARLFDLDQVRTRYGGMRWTMVVLAIFLSLGAAAGWSMLPRSI